MNKCILILCFACFYYGVSYAQLPDGSTVPDFTFVDINGDTQNLYTYLNQGKYVAIDVSTTWCSPCWDYHITRIVDSLCDKHDVPGDATWKVLFIEADPSTTSADLHGTGGNTRGDWVTGSNYSIIDPPAGAALNSFNSLYNIFSYPTLMVICPNKKLLAKALNSVLKPSVQDWETAASHCATAWLSPVNEHREVLSVYPNPVKDVLNVNCTEDGLIELSVADIYGKIIDHKYVTSGFKYDLSNLVKGIYLFHLKTNNHFLMSKVVVQ